jgi:hypothetical protein
MPRSRHFELNGPIVVWRSLAGRSIGRSTRTRRIRAAAARRGQGAPETVAAVRCVECGREAEPGELWRLFFADLGEVAVYCPGCAEREFGGD